MAVRQMYEQFLIELPTEFKEHTEYNALDMAVRDLAKKLFESTIFEHTGISGGNNSRTPLKCQIKGENFLIPKNSRRV